MKGFFDSVILLLILVNPFLVIVYLTDLVQTLNARVFSGILIRGGLIASGISDWRIGPKYYFEIVSTIASDLHL